MVESPTARIASWDDVKTQLSQKYPLAAQPDGSIDVTLPSSKKPIALRQHDMGGEAWLEVVGIVGSVRHIAPTPVLSRNFALPIGNLAVVDGNLLLRQVLPLSGMRVADLDDALSFVATAMSEGEPT